MTEHQKRGSGSDVQAPDLQTAPIHLGLHCAYRYNGAWTEYWIASRGSGYAVEFADGKTITAPTYAAAQGAAHRWIETH